MEIRITDDFDLIKIAESGQCFRWKQIDHTTFRIIAGDQCVYVTPKEKQTYCFDCDEKTFNDVWASYFDLKDRYQMIRERISRHEDPFLWEAMEHEKGIRILRQDPWEMLITSIITQNRNIPAIQRSIELLSKMCGTRCYDSRGEEYYGFPKPDQLITLNEAQLIACKLGYRWKYVRASAIAVAEGSIDLNELQKTGCNATVNRLTHLYGIGNKVASCVALFGLHQLDAFPRDVWINRVLENEYPDGYPFERYSPYNGVYQQYMFAYYRNRKFARGS